MTRLFSSREPSRWESFSERSNFFCLFRLIKAFVSAASIRWGRVCARLRVCVAFICSALSAPIISCPELLCERSRFMCSRLFSCLSVERVPRADNDINGRGEIPIRYWNTRSFFSFALKWLKLPLGGARMWFLSPATRNRAAHLPSCCAAREISPNNCSFPPSAVLRLKN